MFRSFSTAYSPQKLPSSHYSRSTISPSENHNQTQATTLCDNLPKTPPSMRSKSPKYSLDNLMKEESNHIPRLGVSSRNQILISTGGTDQGSEIIHRSLDSFYTEAESKKKIQQEDSAERDLAVTKVHRISSISGADPFEEQIDEFPEIMSISPFKEVEDEPHTRESPKGLRPRAFLMVQTKQPMYHTSTKASPFSRGLNSNEKSARLIDSLDDIIKDHHIENSKMRRKVFMDVEIIKRVCDFLEYGDIASLNSVYLSYREYKTYHGVFMEELFSKFLEGPKKKQQYLFWSTVLHSRGHIYEDAIAWTEHSNNPCDVADTIAKDVDRTLIDCEIFQNDEGREPLLKVLMALCNTYPELGYVQGFNSLAGVSLLNLQEQEAYSLIIHLFEDLKVKQLFLNDFEGLSLLNYQLEIYLEHYLPEIFLIFKQNSMNISYYTYSWFITLFADNLRLPNVMKLWNFFFIRGFPFLLQFALATFYVNKEKILKMDIDDVGHFVKSYLWDLDQDEKELFKIALTFAEVTPKLMRDLESFYKAGKTRVKLVKPKDRLMHWEIQSPNNKPHSSPEASSKSRESEKWSGKKLAPFFKNVFTAVTVDFPDTVKNLFKKSTPRPEIKEDEKPKEEEKKEENHTPMKEIDLNIIENPSSRSSQKHKRRSIATRMRKSMGRTIHSKRGRESTKKHHNRNSKASKNQTEQSPTLPEGDLLKINWDEIPGYTSDNDPKTGNREAWGDENDDKENNDVNLQSTPEIYSGRARSAISETDCSNIDQEFDNVPDFVNKRRGVNEYVLKNNKAWHIEDNL